MPVALASRKRCVAASAARASRASLPGAACFLGTMTTAHSRRTTTGIRKGPACGPTSRLRDRQGAYGSGGREIDGTSQASWASHTTTSCCFQAHRAERPQRRRVRGLRRETHAAAAAPNPNSSASAIRGEEGCHASAGIAHLNRSEHLNPSPTRPVRHRRPLPTTCWTAIPASSACSSARPWRHRIARVMRRNDLSRADAQSHRPRRQERANYRYFRRELGSGAQLRSLHQLRLPGRARAVSVIKAFVEARGSNPRRNKGTADVKQPRH